MEKSNRYIIIYATLMVVLVAVVLTIVAVLLKPSQDENIRVEKMQNILESINIKSDDKSQAEISDLFNNNIVAGTIINSKGEVLSNDLKDVFNIELSSELKKTVENQRFPVYKALSENKDTTYIIQLYGKGLWGPLWGYMSFKNDFNTINGAVFSHKGETPGLGAEIAESWFSDKFINKSIFDDQNKLVSIKLVKGGAKAEDNHAVDAISGGTITSNGLQDMILDNLSSYEAYIVKMKESK